jgi:hypothetical protein
VPDDPHAPFSVRIGARLPDRELWEGVPDWLLDPLLDWPEQNMRSWSVNQLMLRLRLSVPDSDSPKRALRNALGERARQSERGRWDVLDAVDFICQTVEDLWIPAGWTGREPLPGSDPLTLLDGILAAGGSAYHCRKGRLERRVDDTAVAAFERATATANDEASILLRRVWTATYGRDPEPSRAYGEAVRAVEAVACPLLLPDDPKPTLGRVVARLRDRPDDWLLVLPGEREAVGVAPVRLWTAQRSRHAGGSDTRDQLQVEAEAALSLAVMLVQWFTSGFIRRHDDPSSE